MTSEDFDAFSRLMVRLSAGYPQDLMSDSIGFYFDRLRDLSLPIVTAAAQQAVLTCKRFPTVAHIREAAFARRVESRRDKPKGTYPPDVAAQRRRFGLDPPDGTG